MDFIEVVNKRRTTRHFQKGIDIPKETLEKIADAAFKSPTSSDTQGIDIIIVTNTDMKRKINETTVAALPEDLQKSILGFKQKGINDLCTYDASAIFLLVKNERATEKFEKIDAGIILQSILLAATYYGYDSVPLGILTVGDLSELLGIPKNSVMVGAAIGKMDQSCKFPPKSVKAKLTFIE